jgi:hypothetical protein
VGTNFSRAITRKRQRILRLAGGYAHEPGEAGAGSSYPWACADCPN